MDKQPMAEEQVKDDVIKELPHNEKKESFFVELVKVIFWALVIIVPVRTFLFQPFFVQGASMEPNFYDGEYLIVNELGYKQTDFSLAGKEFFSVKSFKELNRSDVVVFRYPNDPSQYFIKRIIGLPGERVEITNGLVRIFNKENPTGFLLEEKAYLPKTPMAEEEHTFTLKPDEYLVLGDNRNRSSDSRVWGPVPEKNIIGKVLLRAWPVDKATLFN